MDQVMAWCFGITSHYPTIDVTDLWCCATSNSWLTWYIIHEYPPLTVNGALFPFQVWKWKALSKFCLPFLCPWSLTYMPKCYIAILPHGSRLIHYAGLTCLTWICPELLDAEINILLKEGSKHISNWLINPMILNSKEGCIMSMVHSTLA